MHEQALARKILAQAGAHGKVLSLHVECGELAPLPATDLEQALKALAHCDIHVTEIPATVSCTCGFHGRPKVELHSHDALVYCCPKCGGVPTLVSGSEIVLANVTVE